MSTITKSKDELTKMSVKDLKALCKEKGVKNFSKLKKEELITSLINFFNTTTPTPTLTTLDTAGSSTQSIPSPNTATVTAITSSSTATASTPTSTLKSKPKPKSRSTTSKKISTFPSFITTPKQTVPIPVSTSVPTTSTTSAINQSIALTPSPSPNNSSDNQEASSSSSFSASKTVADSQGGRDEERDSGKSGKGFGGRVLFGELAASEGEEGEDEEGKGKGGEDVNMDAEVGVQGGAVAGASRTIGGMDQTDGSKKGGDNNDDGNEQVPSGNKPSIPIPTSASSSSPTGPSPPLHDQSEVTRAGPSTSSTAPIPTTNGQAGLPDQIVITQATTPATNDDETAPVAPPTTVKPKKNATSKKRKAEAVAPNETQVEGEGQAEVSSGSSKPAPKKRVKKVKKVDENQNVEIAGAENGVGVEIGSSSLALSGLGGGEVTVDTTGDQMEVDETEATPGPEQEMIQHAGTSSASAVQVQPSAFTATNSNNNPGSGHNETHTTDQEMGETVSSTQSAPTTTEVTKPKTKAVKKSTTGAAPKGKKRKAVANGDDVGANEASGSGTAQNSILTNTANGDEQAQEEAPPAKKKRAYNRKVVVAAATAASAADGAAITGEDGTDPEVDAMMLDALGETSGGGVGESSAVKSKIKAKTKAVKKVGETKKAVNEKSGATGGKEGDVDMDGNAEASGSGSGPQPMEGVENSNDQVQSTETSGLVTTATPTSAPKIPKSKTTSTSKKPAKALLPSTTNRFPSSFSGLTPKNALSATSSGEQAAGSSVTPSVAEEASPGEADKPSAAVLTSLSSPEQVTGTDPDLALSKSGEAEADDFQGVKMQDNPNLDTPNKDEVKISANEPHVTPAAVARASGFSGLAIIRPPQASSSSAQPVAAASSCAEPILEFPTFENPAEAKHAYEQAILASWLERDFRALEKAKNATAGDDVPDSSPSPKRCFQMIAQELYLNPQHPDQFSVALRYIIARMHTKLQSSEWNISKLPVVKQAEPVIDGLWKITETGPNYLLICSATGDVVASGTKPMSEEESQNQTDDMQKLVLLDSLPEFKLRADWAAWISENMKEAKSLKSCIMAKEDLTYPQGISKAWRVRMAEDDSAVQVAERYVMSNVLLNSISGNYQSVTQLNSTWTGQGNIEAQSSKPKLNFYFPESHHLEAISFEVKVGNSMIKLHPAIALAHRKDTTDIILRSTGQVIGNQEAGGVTELWQNMLGCDEKGVGLSTADANEKADKFFAGRGVAGRNERCDRGQEEEGVS